MWPRCALTQMLRRARTRGGGIERPAEMLARVAQPDVEAVMREHFTVERADQRQLFAERRRRLAAAGSQIARELAGKPRPALGAAADHHGVGLRRRKRRVGVVEVSMSPLTTTGIATASLTARTAAQSARPL